MTNFSKSKKVKAVLPVYVRGLAKGKYTLSEAAASTGYSVGWLWKLKEAWKLRGDSVFENKRCGRIPKNKISQATRQRIAALYAGKYSDVNFTYFRDCLAEFEDLKLSLPTLRSILLEYGLHSPNSRKYQRHKVIHRPRIRRDCEGDLLQIDGTPFAWFYKSGDEKRYCMTGAIDDATGKITGLYITENECLYGYLEIMRQTAANYGIPREIYSDRAAIFCFTPRGPKLSPWEKLEVLHEKRTQWQRILEELHINQILAWSPEAKGRVERMWRTLQGQLPIWFYAHGISTVEAANAALPKYIKQFNSKYAVEPRIDDPFYIDAPENLGDILCAQFERRVSVRGVIRFQNEDFIIPERPDLVGVDVTVCISERGLFARFKGKYYRIQPIEGYLRHEINDKMPQVVVNIVYRYLFAFAKEISA